METPTKIEKYRIDAHKLNLHFGKVELRCNGNTYYPNYGKNGYLTNLKEFHRCENPSIGDKINLVQIGDNIVEVEFINNNTIEPKKNPNDKPIVSCVEEKFIEHDSQSLEALIEDIRYKVNNYTFKFCKEETVRREIIDRVLKEIGWTFVNIDVEASCRSESGNVDYAIKKGSKYQILIEAKAIDEDVNDKDNIGQLKNYMNDKRFFGSIGIITNGYDWICKMSEKTIQTNLESEEFCSFLKLFSYNTFSVEALKKFDLCEKSTQIIERRFDIIYDNNESIIRPNPTDTLNAFVKKHAAKIVNIRYQLPAVVITDNINDLRKTTWNAAKKPTNCWIDNENNKKYYIVRDYSTFFKRMLIQQIIKDLDLKARIVDK